MNINDRLSNKIPAIILTSTWTQLFESPEISKFETEVLPNYLMKCRWFGSKSHKIQAISVMETIAVSDDASSARLSFLRITYGNGHFETYLLPLSFAFFINDIESISVDAQVFICILSVDSHLGYVYDGVYDSNVCDFFLRIISQEQQICFAANSFLTGIKGDLFDKIIGKRKMSLQSRVLRAEQSNTSILYDDVFFLKLFRKLHEGINPDVEITRYLTEKKYFDHIAAFCGTIEYKNTQSKASINLCLLQVFIKETKQDAWKFMVDFFKKMMILVVSDSSGQSSYCIDTNYTIKHHCKASVIFDLSILEKIKLLGQRTAQMHDELSAQSDLVDFGLEPITDQYIVSLQQNMVRQVLRTFDLLDRKFDSLPKKHKNQIMQLFKHREKILSIIPLVCKESVGLQLIRIHGDYHLGQILDTGDDIVIIDFEGEPGISLKQRREKGLVFQDIAGMIRSFDYAINSALLEVTNIQKQQFDLLQKCSQTWLNEISENFILSYIGNIKNKELVCKGNRVRINMLVNIFALVKSLYELEYELNNRRDWITIPLAGVQAIIVNL